MAEQSAATVPVLYVDPPIHDCRCSEVRRCVHPSTVHSYEHRPATRSPDPGRSSLPRAPRGGHDADDGGPPPAPSPRRGHVLGGFGSGARHRLAAVPGCRRLWRERGGVYWAQDDFVGLAELHGTNGELGRPTRAEGSPGDADVVVAANPLVRGDLAVSWPRRQDHPVRLRGRRLRARGRVGAPERRGGSSSPVVGFVGRINERIDLRAPRSGRRPRSVAVVGGSAHPVVPIGSTRRCSSSDRMCRGSGPVPFERAPRGTSPPSMWASRPMATLRSTGAAFR